jgi:hypothetical protein
MLKAIVRTVVVALFIASSVYAQDPVGDWQGTLKIPQRPQLRTIIHISKAENGGWNASMLSIDQSPDWGYSG